MDGEDPGAEARWCVADFARSSRNEAANEVGERCISAGKLKAVRYGPSVVILVEAFRKLIKR